MSLTPDRLAAIKTTMDNIVCECGHTANEHDTIPDNVGCFACACFSSKGKVILIDYARLTRHNQRMSAVLAQLSDKENWLQAIGLVALSDDNEIAGIGSDAEFTYIWMASNNPQQLAERALVEDN